MAKRTYDIYLNGQGYMLAPGMSGFTSHIATPFATKSTQGDYTLADFDLYSMISQGDFRSGMGQLKLDETTKYLWGHRIDARGERVTLGPQMASTQPDSADASGTTGQLDSGEALNAALAQEPDTQTHYWQTLDATTARLCYPFVSGTVLASWAPTDLSGLVLWLKADSGVYQDSAGTTAATAADDPVGKWSDLSGTANHFLQSTANARPLLKLAQQNSLPTIKADGSNDFLAGAAPVLGATPRTIFIVIKGGSALDNMYLDLGNYGTGTGTGDDYAIANTGGNLLRVYLNNGNRIWTTGLGTAAYKILCIRQTGANANTLEAYVDGAALTVSSTTAVAINTGADARLYSRTDLITDAGDNYLGEVLVYNSSLSDADRAKVEAYLGSRWGLTVSAAPAYTVERLWAYVRSSTGIVASTVNYTIRADDAGIPGAIVTNGTTAAMVASDMTNYGTWLDLSFATAPSLTADTQFWMCVEFASVGGESLDVLTAYPGASTVSSYTGTAGGTPTWDPLNAYVPLIWCQFPILHPDGPIRKFVEFNGYVYALVGKHIYKMTGVRTVTYVSKAFAANVTDAMVVRKATDTADRLLVALGNGQAMEYWDGTTWTAITSQQAVRLTFYDRLWWRANEDATTGVYVQGSSAYTDWSTAGTAGVKVAVGDRRFPILALFSWNNNLYAAKRDGLYAITYPDDYPAAIATAIQATKVVDLSSELHPGNFQAFAIFQSDLFFSLASGVARLSSSFVLGSVTPDASLLQAERKRGEFTAMVPTLTNLYCAWQSDVGDWTQWLSYNSGGWHSLATSDRTGDLVRAMFVDSARYGELPRIWTSSGPIITSWAEPTWSLRRWTFAEGTPGANVGFWYRDPDVYGAEHGRLYTSWMDANLLNIIKNWINLDVVADGIDGTSTTMAVYWRDDEASAWVQLGATITASGTTSLAFPTNTSTRKLQLRFDMMTTANELTPQLLGYALRYVPRPYVKERFAVRLLVSSSVVLRGGAHEYRSAEQQYSDLREARKSTGTVTFVDEFGNSYQVHVSECTRQREKSIEVNAEQYEGTYIVSLDLLEA